MARQRLDAAGVGEIALAAGRRRTDFRATCSTNPGRAGHAEATATPNTVRLTLPRRAALIFEVVLVVVEFTRGRRRPRGFAGHQKFAGARQRA